MSTFISGVANPMTPNPHTRRPPKTPQWMIDGAHKPRLSPEEREKLVEQKKKEWAAEAQARADALPGATTSDKIAHQIEATLGQKYWDNVTQTWGSKPMRGLPTKGTKTTGPEASVN